MIDRYAVIGNPISQSKSPLIHTAFAAATGQSLHYGLIEGTLGAFQAAAEEFRAAGGRGLNVTSPFKLDAFDYATVRHDRARLAGAANCLLLTPDRVEADNFDGIGLLRDIEVNLAVPLAGRRVLMLGAGGAARGALEPLLSARPAELIIANRTRARAMELAGLFGGVGFCSLQELDRQGSFDVVINATSVGLHREALDLPGTLFRPGTLAYDMTYGKGLTAFLRLAASSGATRIHDGVGMLVEQAAEAFAWWRGVRPGTRDVIALLALPLR